MTTEEDFQAALDADPDDWQTRLVFADWLQDRGDERAEGYRALGVLRRVPTSKFFQPHSSNPWYLWYSAAHVDNLDRNRTGPQRDLIESLLVAALPADWCAKIRALAPAEERRRWNHRGGWFGYGVTRREAEDAAALAFARLPPERRAELLAGTPTKPPKRGKRRK
jgi:uncharacterized protein (TIGR02996 family)